MRKKIPLIGGIINLIESLKGDIGIIENTDVATHSISAGSYVIWHNELYKASSAIAVDDALSASNLTAVSGGAANELNNKLIPVTIADVTVGTSGEKTFTPSESLDNFRYFFVDLYDSNTQPNVRASTIAFRVNGVILNPMIAFNVGNVLRIGIVNFTTLKIDNTQGGMSLNYRIQGVRY